MRKLEMKSTWMRVVTGMMSVALFLAVLEAGPFIRAGNRFSIGIGEPVPTFLVAIAAQTAWFAMMCSQANPGMFQLKLQPLRIRKAGTPCK